MVFKKEINGLLSAKYHYILSHCFFTVFALQSDKRYEKIGSLHSKKKILKGGVVGTLMSIYGLEKFFKSKKIKFSPHQIAFHIKHPHNTFILAKALGPLPPKTSPISMYHGSRINELVASGLKLDACGLGLDACRQKLLRLGA